MHEFQIGVFRIMKRQGLLLQRHTSRRKGRLHDGKVVVMRSNLRWCSDVFEITCWNGDIVRIVFVIDAHDREVLAWHAAAGTSISGSMVRDLMLEAVELRFGTVQARHAVEWLSDKGSPLTATGNARLRRCSRPGAMLHPRCRAPSRTALPKPFVKSKRSNATTLASIHCRMLLQCSGRSPGGSMITRRATLTQGSE
jgi:transposase InsO family protein